MIETIARIFYVLIALGVVIFIHELGHYLVAKKTGVKVEKFYLGMGPEIIGFDYKGTRYGLAAFPVGGMVKLSGEELPSETARLEPGDFFYQPWYKRILIALAGAVMNLIFAIMVFSMIIKLTGVSTPLDEPVVGSLRENMPAARAGLKEGDRILSVDGKSVKSWRELAEYIHSKPGVEISLEVERPGKEKSDGGDLSYEKFKVVITPQKSNEAGGVGLIGINPPFKNEKAGWIRSVWLGVNKSWWMNYITLAYLWESVTRARKPELAGPVGIVGELAKASKRGIAEFLGYLAIISNALALFNLLPIPLLDGGLAALFIFEGISRRPLNEKFVSRINSVGLVFLLTIFVYATYGDITRLFISR